MPNDPNEATLNAYNLSADIYIRKTPSSHNLSSHTWLAKWIDRMLAYTKPNGKVLEIGSATPRDAYYMRSKGFQVQTSDAATSFLQYLKEQGENPMEINIIKGQIQGAYDIIFANAVFPHLTNEQTAYALDNILQALNTGGIFAFNVKKGAGEEWINEKMKMKRYINYWQAESISTFLLHHGFKILALDDDIKGDLPNHVWIHIIATRA